MNATDRHHTDRRQTKASANAPPIKGGGIIMYNGFESVTDGRTDRYLISIYRVNTLASDKNLSKLNVVHRRRLQHYTDLIIIDLLGLAARSWINTMRSNKNNTRPNVQCPMSVTA